MNIGDKAPEILGINEKGEEIRLSNYAGKKIVLYFPVIRHSLGCKITNWQKSIAWSSILRFIL